MEIFLIIIFVIGYLAIALEHPIKIDKAASALVMGGVIWGALALGIDELVTKEFLTEFYEKFKTKFNSLKELGFYSSDEYAKPIKFLKYELSHHLVDIGEILFFLLAAMTIVELVDSHQGFSIITDKITTKRKVPLMWILCVISFFFSAVLDNLTTSIVMAALISKMIKDKKDLWMFAGMIIISANAGGAWSPMGDVTTIMLWVGGQVTAWNIIYSIFIPSLVCMIVPLIYISFKLKGSIENPDLSNLNSEISSVNTYERNLIFYMGVIGLLFVPIFKITTGLPPYLGMLLSLGILWVTTEILHSDKNYEQRRHLSVIGVLKKVDTPTIFFFLGILLAVAGLQSAGQLDIVAKYLENTFSGENKIYIINVLIGLMSALVDNVPLVAGAMGMYEIGPIQDGILAYPQDHKFWQFLAYCAGTGGSVLIIGSAAGVAVMGILKIDFMWYLKRISFLALIGYVAGAITYIIMQ
ncbi:sodium:proton antiporter NhaD [Bacteroidota bacterium]|nr:sodium:proton antiporter NhaD [Bacteroidota bacterium]MDC3115064.1 sodium:proton antiporter NhaD [Bacteroidota bacterium]MDC3230672.1 sodium:proton antiporter NhaD [Bacteroidota bacterium]